MTEIKHICQHCVVPNNFLGVSLNGEGLCNYCQDASYKTINWWKVDIDEALRRKSLKDWNKVVHSMQKNHGALEYDCILGYSGGKDSTALVDTFVNEYGLNPLLITIDTGFMTEVAKQNIKDTLTKMNLFENHIFIEEAIPVFTKLYKYFFFHHTSQELALTIKICPVCTDLIHTILVKEALKRRIPYVMIGFSPDQIKRYFYETSKENTIEDGIPDEEFRQVLNPQDVTWYLTEDEIDSGNIPRVLYPYHVIDYDENEIIERIESKGLIAKGKGDPVITNCHVVKAALMYDLYRYGGVTYILQYAELVRQQKTDEERKKSRSQWLRVYNQVSRAILKGTFSVEGINLFLEKIGTTKEELLNSIIAQRNADPNKVQILQNLELLRRKRLK